MTHIKSLRLKKKRPSNVISTKSNYNYQNMSTPHYFAFRNKKTRLGGATSPIVSHAYEHLDHFLSSNP